MQVTGKLGRLLLWPRLSLVEIQRSSRVVWGRCEHTRGGAVANPSTPIRGAALGCTKPVRDRTERWYTRRGSDPSNAPAV